MAGNYITIGSKFKPFSYEELVKPYEKYGNAYKEQESLFSDIQAQSNEIADQINAQREAESFNIYKGYNDKLTEQAAQLSKEGLNIGSRKNLIDMRNRYSKEILPMKKLIETRSKMADEQRQLYAKDKSIMYDKDFSTISLDELRQNPNVSYKALSGNELTAKSSALASAFKDQLYNNPTYEKILGGQYFQAKIKSGMSIDQILAAAVNDKNAPEELKNIKTGLLKEYGVDQYSKDIQQRAEQAINDGLYSALGVTKLDTQGNGEYMTLAQRQANAISQGHLRLAQAEYDDRKQAALEADALYPTSDGGFYRTGTGGVMYKYNANKQLVGTYSATGKFTPMSNTPFASTLPKKEEAGYFTVDDKNNPTSVAASNNKSKAEKQYAKLSEKKRADAKVSFVELPQNTKKGIMERIQDEVQNPDLTPNMIDQMYDFYMIGEDKGGRTIQYVPKRSIADNNVGL